MPGPDPKPKSMEPAVRACCSRPSPWKVEISASSPTDFQIPCLTPNSRPENGKDEMIALPTRTFFSSCAEGAAGKPDAKAMPDANRARTSRRLVCILLRLIGLSARNGASSLAAEDLQLGWREASCGE